MSIRQSWSETNDLAVLALREITADPLQGIKPGMRSHLSGVHNVFVVVR